MADELTVSLDTDPEVMAEVKKNRLLHLRLERWKETAGAVGVILQTFKAEAMSLMSGVGTLVVGWFQLRKYVVKGRAEVRAEGRAQGTAEGRVAGRAAERSERRADRAEARGESRPTVVPTEFPPSPGGTLMAVPDTASTMEQHAFMADPMNYVTVGLPIIFVWSTILAWVKRRRKQLEAKEKTNA